MTKRIALYIIATLTALGAFAQNDSSTKPRLVVNMIVSGMRAVDIERYQSNFVDGGFKLLYNEGLRYDNCQYNYQQTTTPVSLSTLATGAQPSTHGVVGQSWFDYITSEQVDLIADKATVNLGYSPAGGGYSPRNLFVPTLSEALVLDSPQSNAVTVALDPTSAIVISGKYGSPFWFDAYSCSWVTSRHYMNQLPEWVTDHNDTSSDIELTLSKWVMTHHSDLYTNNRYTGKSGGYVLGNAVNVSRNEDRRQRYEKYYKQISTTPIGNDIVASFAKKAIENFDLGADGNVDILNICFDLSRNVVEIYGPESIEAEDMYYKLDQTIADLIAFISGYINEGEVLYTLTSDHGTSPSIAVDATRFNARQFEVILNGFLSVRFGNDDWVLGCRNGAVYIDHNKIYQHGLNLAEVQAEVATFALQLQGVSHAMTSSALSSSYFGSGYAQKIQSGFYPSRSGDVVLNLMPNWIPYDVDRLSQSGSMYNYDRAVPLIFYGKGVVPKVVYRSVDATAIAPTLAAIMDITEPAASEGNPLEELTNR